MGLSKLPIPFGHLFFLPTLAAWITTSNSCVGAESVVLLLLPVLDTSHLLYQYESKAGRDLLLNPHFFPHCHHIRSFKSSLSVVLQRCVFSGNQPALPMGNTPFAGSRAPLFCAHPFGEAPGVAVHVGGCLAALSKLQEDVSTARLGPA